MENCFMEDLIVDIRKVLDEWGWRCYYDDEGVELTLNKIIEVLKEYKLCVKIF